LAGIILVVSLCSEGRIAWAAPSETVNMREQETTSPSNGEDSTRPADTNVDDPEYNGEDFTRPQRRIDFRPRYQNSGSTTKTDRQVYPIRLSDFFRSESGFGFSWFVEIPATRKSVETSKEQTTTFGLDDIEAQLALFQQLNPRWAYGAGVDILAPSAGDSLGDGKWQIKPTVGFRYSFVEYGPNTYFVPKIRYALSVAGDSSRRNITEVQFAPTLSIGLPNRWFAMLYPSYDIRVNYGKPISGQAGRLFLPFDGAVGRNVTDSISLLLEVGAPLITHYPVYKWKTEFRVSAKF
jgi:hypothetical protein